MEDKGKNCKENKVSKESKYADKKQLTGRNAAGSRTFMLTVYNPASCTGILTHMCTDGPYNGCNCLSDYTLCLCVIKLICL